MLRIHYEYSQVELFCLKNVRFLVLFLNGCAD